MSELARPPSQAPAALSAPAAAAAAGSLQAAAAAFLARPDVVVPEGEDEGVAPVPLAVGAGLGMAGAGAFFAVAFGGVGEVGAGLPLHLVLAPPLAATLTFPPLFLLTGLRGRAPRLLDLLAVSVAGPTVAGIALGASVPLLLLYRLTGELTWAFGLLVAWLMALAFGAGLRAAHANQRRAGESSPGVLVVLAHYLLTLWTALVVALHLA